MNWVRIAHVIALLTTVPLLSIFSDDIFILQQQDTVHIAALKENQLIPFQSIKTGSDTQIHLIMRPMESGAGLQAIKGWEADARSHWVLHPKRLLRDHIDDLFREGNLSIPQTIRINALRAYSFQR